MTQNDRRRITAALGAVREIEQKLAMLRGVVQEVRDNDQATYDDMSDRRREGDAGEALQADISALEEALDAIDALELKPVADAVAKAADAPLPDTASPTISAKEAERRRWARLAPWAQTTITTLRADLKAAQEKARNMFPEPSGRSGEFAICDYGEPLHERIIPARTISVPEFRIQISVDRHGRGLMIRGERSLMIMPEASNTVHVLAKEGF